MPELQHHTLLGFDFGTRRIGVALGNTVTGQARPLTILPSEPIKHRFALIADLLAEWQPQRLVVGLPLTLTGEDQEATRRSRRFANQLHGRFGLPVVLQDERHSSLEAQALQARHAPDDALAASVILQRFLETQAAQPS